MRFLKGWSPRTTAYAAAATTVVIWTSFIVIARATTDPARGATLLPFDIVVCRILGAGLVLLPVGWWLARRDAAVAPGRSSFFGFSPLPWGVTASAGVFGGVLYGVWAYSGFVHAPAAHASVLLPGSLPLWTAMMAVLLLGERLGAARLAGLLLIVVGDLVVGGASLLRAFDGGTVWKGDLMFMVASLCWACYTVVARKYALEAIRATAAITVFAAFTFLPLYALAASAGWVASHFWEAPLHDILFQMFFQGCGSVVISGITFTRMVQYFGPVRTTMFTAIVPGSSALAAVYFLGEPLTWNLWAGLGLVTLGILLGVLRFGAPAAAARTKAA